MDDYDFDDSLEENNNKVKSENNKKFSYKIENKVEEDYDFDDSLEEKKACIVHNI